MQSNNNEVKSTYRKSEILVPTIAIVLILACMIAIAIFGWHITKTQQDYKNWYNSLSTEDRAAVDLANQIEYEKNVERYEATNVSKYVRTKTNLYGGITDTDICYTFSYIDKNGQLRHVKDFESMHVIIGDQNVYIIDSNDGKLTRKLQLTKETLENIQTLTTG